MNNQIVAKINEDSTIALLGYDKYPYYWIKNTGETTIYATTKSIGEKTVDEWIADYEAGHVDHAVKLQPQEAARLEGRKEIITLIAADGGLAEFVADNLAECPFKVAAKGGGKIEALTVNENGTYTASGNVKGYSPVTVDVPEYIGYTVKGIPSTPTAVASFSDGTDLPMPALKVGIEPVQSGRGDPSPANIRPISGWTGCNVSVCEKNYLPLPTLENGWENGYVNINGGISSPTLNKEKVYHYIPITPNTEFSYYVKYDTSVPVWVGIGCYDANKNFITRKAGTYEGTSEKTVVFTTPNNCAYIRVSLRTFDDEVEELQLSYEPITDYVPYTGANYSISFPTEAGTVYGGTLDVVAGTLTVDRANIASYDGETLPSAWMSDRDVYAEGTTPTTGAQVVYQLETPITYQLSPTAVQTLLGQNIIYADTGDIVEGEYLSIGTQEQPWQPLEDGYSNFWFELTNDTLSPWLNFSAKNDDAVIDWGDGSGEVALDTLTPTHTYSKAGKYVVKVKGVTGIARQNVEPLSGGYLGALKYIELNSEVLELQNFAFHRCIGLIDTAIPNGVTMGTYAFGFASSLIKCPNITGITNIPTCFMVYALSSNRLTLAEGVTQVGTSSFHNNVSLRYLSLPSTITSIGQTGFGTAVSLSEIHIAATTPPTLGTTAFSSLPSDYIIYVPVGTGETYKAAAGWRTYAGHILEEGQTVTRAMKSKFAKEAKAAAEAEDK